MSNYFLKRNSKSENVGLNVSHIEIFDPYCLPVTWNDFTILHSSLLYLHTFTPKRVSKVSFCKKKKRKLPMYLIFLLVFFLFLKIYFLTEG